MQIIPVIDIRGGEAVAAVGGRRHEYQRLELPWRSGSDPVALARDVRQRYPIETIYIADLGAIEGRGGLDAAAIARLAETGPTWIDAGLRDVADRARLPGVAGLRPILGLETLRGPNAFREPAARAVPDGAVFSFDLRNGRPLTAPGSTWPAVPVEIVREAIAAGVRDVILLDIGLVGGGRGLAVWAVPLLRTLRDAGAEARWYAGGGLRDASEMDPLREAGFSGVLVGSALWSGALDGVLAVSE